MKTPRILLVGLGLLSFPFSGCVSNPAGTSPIPTAATATNPLAAIAGVMGPPIAQIANERLALVILKGHPGREATLQHISDDLSLLVAGTNAGEITDAAIKAFVAERAAKWGLLPGEENLVSSALVATRQQFLASTGKTVVLLSDPTVTVYIAAIRQGISDGIADNARRNSAK